MKKRLQKEQNELFKAILELRSLTECRNFFRDLCTPSELDEFAYRWRVAFLLTKKIPYRQIAEKTGVSTTTVGRVARCLKHGHNGYNLILSRQKEENGKP